MCGFQTCRDTGGLRLSKALSLHLSISHALSLSIPPSLSEIVLWGFNGVVRPQACECVRLCCVVSVKQRDVFSCGRPQCFISGAGGPRHVCFSRFITRNVCLCSGSDLLRGSRHRSRTFRSKFPDVLEPRGTQCSVLEVGVSGSPGGSQVCVLMRSSLSLASCATLPFQSSLPELRQKRIF